ncbi:MAG: hypothetical protein SH819_12785 [Cytophagales bacterium]|nr:hypothetical protein [Cytophagales bacterium]
MKRSNLLIALILLGISASFMNCGSDPAPAVDPKNAQLTKLSKTWKVINAASDVTFTTGSSPQPVAGYGSFTVTVTSTPGSSTFNYSITGRPSPTTAWPASGTFTFETDFATVVKRDDGILITYSVTDTKLQLNFNYTGAGFNSRVGNVQGSWSFTLGL